MGLTSNYQRREYTHSHQHIAYILHECIRTNFIINKYRTEVLIDVLYYTVDWQHLRRTARNQFV